MTAPMLALALLGAFLTGILATIAAIFGYAVFATRRIRDEDWP